MAQRHGDEVLADERSVAGQQLPEHDPQRVDVGRRRDLLAAGLLGREVLGGAEHRARLRDAVLHVQRARNAEVGDLDLALAAEEDVLRLDVAMDEPTVVRKCEPVGDPERELERPPHRQFPGAQHELLEVLAVDVLEDDVLPSVVVPAVDDGDDVRVREPRDRARLAAEALEVFRILGVVLVEDLDRDAPIELAVVRAKDARHPAGAEELLELVPVGDQIAGLRRPGHGSGIRPRSRHACTTQERQARLPQDRFERLLPRPEPFLELGVRDHEWAENPVAVRMDAGLEEQQPADGGLLGDARGAIRTRRSAATWPAPLRHSSARIVHSA